MGSRTLGEQNIRPRQRVSGRSYVRRPRRTTINTRVSPFQRNPLTGGSSSRGVGLRDRIGTAIRISGLVVAIGGLIVGLVMVTGEVGAAQLLSDTVVSEGLERATVARLPENQVDFVRTEDTDYIVAEGETLSEIADRFDLTSDLLASYNDLDDPDALTPGQRVIIPGEDYLSDYTMLEFIAEPVAP